MSLLNFHVKPMLDLIVQKIDEKNEQKQIDNGKEDERSQDFTRAHRL
jgi:hypothetical protein